MLELLVLCVAPMNAQGIVTTITTVAGNGTRGSSGDGGPAALADFVKPFGVAVDAAGNLYIADCRDYRVRKVSTQGIISTFAGTGTNGFSGDGAPATSAQLNCPAGIAVDAVGNVYIANAENNRVRKVNAQGIISTFAGTSTNGFSGDGGPAAFAGLNGPWGIAVDAAGNLYIADSGNSRVRKVNAQGIISTVAGNGTNGFSGDGGPATLAALRDPRGIAVDAAGNLYISDSGSNRVRKVNTQGIISTVVGNGTNGFSGDGGPATLAALSGPWQYIAVDAIGNLYIADAGNYRVRKVNAQGIISTVAGNGTNGFSGDRGPGGSAKLNYLFGVAVDAVGNVYIADAGNRCVRKVNAQGIISTVAGPGGVSGDGGPATLAGLYDPSGVVVDAAGNLYITDCGNDRVRKVNTQGIISTVAGNSTNGFSGDGGPAISAQLNCPGAVAVDAAGNVYIADAGNNRVRRVNAAGVISTFAGNGMYFCQTCTSSSNPNNGDGGPAALAGLSGPQGIAVDAAGNLYLADNVNNRVRKVNAQGIISTVAGNGTNGFSGDGGMATGARLYDPFGLAVDATGNLYIADVLNFRVRKVNTQGIISTVAGNGTNGFSGDGGPGASARLNNPFSVAVDDARNLYIADVGNNRIRRVNAQGIISTFAGTGGPGGFSGDGGPATLAGLSGPSGVAMDAAENLYIVDSGNRRVRKVVSSILSLVITTASPLASGTVGVAYSQTLSATGGLQPYKWTVTAGAPPPDTSLFFSIAAPTTVTLRGTPTGNGGIFSFTVQVTDSSGNTASATFQITIAPLSFSIANGGGMSLTTPGTATAAHVGYGFIQPSTGSTTPAALAIFGFRENGILVTEAGVPASLLVQSGRIYADVNGPVNTGLAIVNPNGDAATITFYFTDSNGNDFGQGSTLIPPGGQIAKFLTEAPFSSGASVSGTFTFTSSEPIAAIALRGFTNERSEFLITTLPVIPLSTVVEQMVIFPHFADGLGWTSQVVLVNPTDTAMGGTMQFFGQGSATAAGQAVPLTVNGQVSTSFSYSIPPRSSRRFQTSGTSPRLLTGSVRVTPDNASSTPSGVLVFSYMRENGILANGGITVTQAGVPAISTSSAFRMYVETSGDFIDQAVGSIQTGIAIANPTSTVTTMNFELTTLAGASTGLTGSTLVPAQGQAALFLDQIQGFASLPNPFKGVLRISSQSGPITVIGLRGRYNERGDFLITTTSPIDENNPASSASIFIPQLVDGGGYTTQFILFSGQAGQTSSGTLQFISQSGGTLSLSLRP